VNLSFDLELTGFDTWEIDHTLNLDLPEYNVSEDEKEIPPVATIPISAKGDIWLCGRHRVGCGDALDQVLVDSVRDGRKADVVFTDPPYNLKIGGFVSGKGSVQHREFVQAAGEMSAAEFTSFLVTALDVLQTSSMPGAVIFACMDWRHVFELIDAGRQRNLELLNICVWAKTNAGMGSLYRNQHELICVFKTGSAPHINNVELGRHGRNRSNLWTYRGLNAFGQDRDVLLASHPTVKPVLMIADALRDVTKRGSVVLDTFMGSGSTLMAAEETGRVCLGTEIDPLYVDVAIRRWQNKTAGDAIHAVTGELFNERAGQLTHDSPSVPHG
jgi:DNA modification methylase